MKKTFKKILITGANGYIGKHVVKEALNEGYSVIACDIKFDDLDSRAIKCTIPIFNDDVNLYENLGRPDICIHLAWRNGFVHNHPSHMEELSKHIKFCNLMMESGLESLSVMGTMHEVGYWEGAIDENTPCNPLSQYGVAKNALRQSLLISSSNSCCKLKWLRAFYITGDELRGNNIFSKISKAEADGKIEFPFTSGKNKYDFVDVDELSKMIVRASTQNDINGIINVCKGNPISLGECVEEFIKNHNYKIKLKYNVYPNRKYDSPGIWGDSTKINSILNDYKNVKGN